ncbi:MAG: TAXI family TRAP transporter solute-binding subunit [Rhodospirillales bacterium]
MKKHFLGLICVLLASSVSLAHAQGKVMIGTGGETGVYYATGQVLCGLLKATGIDCDAPPGKGSVANLMALNAGAVHVAMVQSDWQFHAYSGSSKWKGDKIDRLRALFSVYAEPVQVVVNRDAGIKNWYGLKGHSINIGNPGSGQRETMEEMLDAQRWKPDIFSAVSELPSSQQVEAFCAGSFDAFIYTVGIPNDAMKRAVADCNGMLIEPHNTIIRKLATAARPYYSKVTIPAKTYWDGQKKVDTFGVLATLVTTSDADPVVVEALLKAVFENFNGFRAKHPAYANSRPESMVSDGLSAPLHDAARAYYVSKGWIK